MAVCTQHPEKEAAGACEYCGAPQCSDCLEQYLGRWYCPPCAEQVRALALGRTVRVGMPGTGAPPDAGRVPDLRSTSAAALPGWVSVLLYLGAFLFITLATQGVLAAGLVGVRALQGTPVTAPIPDDALGIGLTGLPVWCLLFGVYAWVYLGLIALLTWFFARFVERRRLMAEAFPGGWSACRDMAVGLLLAALLFVSVVGVGEARGWFVVGRPVGWLSAVTILGVSFAILLPLAAVEEIVTRLFMIQAGARSWGRWGAVAASCLVFAVLHGANPNITKHPLALPGLALAGVYLAAAFLITENLWLATFLHAGWNLMLGPAFGLPVSGIDMPAAVVRTSPTGPELWTGGSFGPEGGLLLLLMLLLHLGVLLALGRFLRPKVQAAA